MATAAQVSREPLRQSAGKSSAWGAAAWTPLVWTSLALSGSVLLHADRVPLWVTGIASALIAWRASAGAGIVRLPGKVVRALIAFTLVAAVFFRFHTLNGLNPGTALLVMMTAVKLLETFTRRDQYIVLAGSLFLLLAACLDRQGLLRAPLYLLEVWLCCAAFASVAYSAQQGAIAGTAAAAAPGTTSAAPLAVT